MADNNKVIVELGQVAKERGIYTAGSKYYKDNIVEYMGAAYIAEPTTPNGYVTVAPWTTDRTHLNTGWRVFADGNPEYIEEVADECVRQVNEAIDAYQPIIVEGDVTNASDEEDLTSVNVGGTDIIKFKDKAYAPAAYSGMGRKILRKNIVDGVNTLTQSMINQANTIYIIQYDFVLGEDITVPENCVLEFDGGSLRNGTIIGNNTAFDFLNKTPGFLNIEFGGTFILSEINTKNFSYVDDTFLFRNLSILSKSDILTTIYIENRVYSAYYNDNFTFFSASSNTIIEGNGATISITTSANPTSYRIFNINEQRNVTLRNLNLIGDASVNTGNGEWGHGIAIMKSVDVIIDNCNISYCHGDGIAVTITNNNVEEYNENIIVRNCTLAHNSRCGAGIVSIKGLLLENCLFDANGDTNGRNPKCPFNIEPNTSLQHSYNINIVNCRSINGYDSFINTGNANTSLILIDNFISNAGIVSYTNYKNVILKNSVLTRVIFNNNCDGDNFNILSCILNNQWEYDLYIKNVYYEGVKFYSYLSVKKILEHRIDYNKVYKVVIPKIMGRIKITNIPINQPYNNTVKSISYYIDQYNTSYRGMTVIEAGANLGKGGIRLFNQRTAAPTIQQKIDVNFSNIYIINNNIEIYVKSASTDSQRCAFIIEVEDVSSLLGSTLRKPLIKDNIVIKAVESADVPSDLIYDEIPVNDIQLPSNSSINEFPISDLKTYASQAKDIFSPDLSKKYRVVGSYVKQYKEHYIVNAEYGQSSDRPTRVALLTIGDVYFDETLGKPIWWTGTTWVDATGTTV